MPSDRFDQLQAQLSVLRAHLLPEEFDDTALYEEQEKVATAALAYRVLAHAEIEAFFEDRALEVVTRARTAWERALHVSRVAISLIAFSGKEMAAPPETLEPPTENGRKAWPALLDLGKRLAAVITSYNQYIRMENHGIKEKNILSILLPIGVDHSKIDPTFLAEIESFGSLRGLTAHTSSRGTIRQAVDPEQEFKRVESLLPGICAIDFLLEEIAAEIPA